MRKSLLIIAIMLGLLLTGCTHDEDNTQTNSLSGGKSETSEPDSSEIEKPSTVEINPPSYY